MHKTGLRLYVHPVIVWDNRRTLLIFVGSLLLVGTVALVCWDAGRYRAEVRGAFRDACIQRVITLEDFAEDWIVRDDVRSLEAAARLLVMGSGLYVDIVVRGNLLASTAREGARMNTVDLTRAPPRDIVAAQLPGGDLEIVAPVVLAGFPDAPIGFLRVAFSDDYATGQIRRHIGLVSGISGACWMLLLAGLILTFRRRASAPFAPSRNGSTVQCGALEIDERTCEARLNGQLLDLTPKLFELLLVFAREPGTVFSDDDLLRSVWSDSTYAASADVKQHIYLLRRRLKRVHADPKALLETVKGFGYRLVLPPNEGKLRGR